MEAFSSCMMLEKKLIGVKIETDKKLHPHRECRIGGVHCHKTALKGHGKLVGEAELLGRIGTWSLYVQR